MSGALSTRPVGSLAKYSPEKGARKIAMLEGAEKAYAKAKDASKLQLAIRAKLEAQAEFVFWWDTHAEKAQGGRPSKDKPVSDLSQVIAGRGWAAGSEDEWNRRVDREIAEADARNEKRTA